MSESIRISVDIDTLEAFQGLRRLVTEMDKLRGETREVKQESEGVQKELRETGTAATTAAAGVAKLDKEHDKLGENAPANIGKVSKQTSLLGAATDSLAKQVQGMVAGYMGFQTVLSVMQQIEAQTRRSIAANKALLEADIQSQEKLANLVSNMPGGEADPANQLRASRLTARVATVGGMTAGMAASLLSGASSAGVPLFNDDGSTNEASVAVLSQIGASAQRANLDEATTATLVKSLKARGISVADMPKALAQMEGMFQKVPFDKGGDFMTVQTRAMSDLLAAGLSMEQGADTMGRFAVVENSAERASTLMQQTLRAALGMEDSTGIPLAKAAHAAGLVASPSVDAWRSMEAKDRFASFMKLLDMQPNENARQQMIQRIAPGDVGVGLLKAFQPGAVDSGQMVVSALGDVTADEWSKRNREWSVRPRARFYSETARVEMERVGRTDQTAAAANAEITRAEDFVTTEQAAGAEVPGMIGGEGTAAFKKAFVLRRARELLRDPVLSGTDRDEVQGIIDRAEGWGSTFPFMASVSDAIMGESSWDPAIRRLGGIRGGAENAAQSGSGGTVNVSIGQYIANDREGPLPGRLDGQ